MNWIPYPIIAVLTWLYIWKLWQLIHKHREEATLWKRRYDSCQEVSHLRQQYAEGKVDNQGRPIPQANERQAELDEIRRPAEGKYRVLVRRDGKSFNPQWCKVVKRDNILRTWEEELQGVPNWKPAWIWSDPSVDYHGAPFTNVDECLAFAKNQAEIEVIKAERYDLGEVYDG